MVYNWSNFNQTPNNLSVGAGVYSLTVSDINNCSVDTTLFMNGVVADSFIIESQYSCDSGGSLIITPLNSGNYSFTVNNTIQSNGLFTDLMGGNYLITIINENGCEYHINATINNNLVLAVEMVPDSLVIELGESGTAEIVVSEENNLTYDWSTTNGLGCLICSTPTFSPITTTDYIVSVSTGWCAGETSIHVEVIKHSNDVVYIPNVFTPNGDGINDYFEVYGENIKLIEMMIFDRWGEKVYESYSPIVKWDGYYKGKNWRMSF